MISIEKFWVEKEKATYGARNIPQLIQSWLFRLTLLTVAIFIATQVNFDSVALLFFYAIIIVMLTFIRDERIIIYSDSITFKKLYCFNMLSTSMKHSLENIESVELERMTFADSFFDFISGNRIRKRFIINYTDKSHIKHWTRFGLTELTKVKKIIERQ